MVPAENFLKNMTAEQPLAARGEMPQLAQLGRLSGILHFGQNWRDLCYFGWTNKGIPMLVTDQKLLSEQVKNQIRLVKTAGLTIPEAEIRGTLLPVEYTSDDLPIDFRDEPQRKVQDLVTLVVTGHDGELHQIHVRELDILEAIEERTIQWQEASRESVFSTSQIRTNILYTVLIPDAENRGVTYALMFKSPLPTESNETSYKRFIEDVILSLCRIDEAQDPENRKGYLDAIKQLVGNDQAGARDGIAFSIIKGLRDMGYIRKTREEIDQLQLDSSGGDIFDQFMLLLREGGYVNKDVTRRVNRGMPATADDALHTMDVTSLQKFVGNVHRRVSQHF